MREAKFSKCSNVSRVLLLVVNSLMLALGVFAIWGGASLNKAGWLREIDVEEVDKYAPIVTWAIIVFGIVLSIVSFIGFYAAYKGNGVLRLWSFLMFFVLIIVLVIVIGGWIAYGINQQWQNRSYPNEEETQLAKDFNDAYCDAQALGLCYSTEPVADLVKNSALLPSDIASQIESLANVLGDLSAEQLCDIPVLKSFFPQIAGVCDQCTEYEKYSSLLTWANGQCPLTPEVSSYCAWELLNTGGPTNVSPYEECRPVLLNKWRAYSLALAVPTTILVVVILISMVIACQIKKKKVVTYDDEPEYHRKP